MYWNTSLFCFCLLTSLPRIFLAFNIRQSSSRFIKSLSRTVSTPMTHNPKINHVKTSNRREFTVNMNQGSSSSSDEAGKSTSPLLSPGFIKKIPNILTIARVFLIPVFLFTYRLEMKYVSLGVFIVAAITDFLDGYLARKLNVNSRFGAFLDPVADKLMVSTALVLLTGTYSLVTVQDIGINILTYCHTAFGSLWFSGPVAVIMGREIAVSALREWMAETGQRATVKVGPLGKIKTVLQMVSICLLLLAMPTSILPVLVQPLLLGTLCLYLSTALTVISGLQYFQAAWPVLTSSYGGGD